MQKAFEIKKQLSEFNVICVREVAAGFQQLSRLLAWLSRQSDFKLIMPN